MNNKDHLLFVAQIKKELADADAVKEELKKQKRKAYRIANKETINLKKRKYYLDNKYSYSEYKKQFKQIVVPIELYNKLQLIKQRLNSKSLHEVIELYLTH